MSTRITFLISDGTKVGLDKQNKNRSVASGLNLYAYCLNDPVNNSDPEGTWSWKKFFIGVAITAAVTAAVALTVVTYGAGAAIAGAGIASYTLATGASISGFGLSFLPSLFISAGAVSTANMAKYSLDYAATDWSGWSIGGLLLSSVQGAIKGASTFAIAFLGGKYGLFDKFANKANDLIFPGVGNIYMPRSLFCWSRMFLGEGGARALFVSAPAFGVRWLIDVINESV